jgi:hypothetical protein
MTLSCPLSVIDLSTRCLRWSGTWWDSKQHLFFSVAGTIAFPDRKLAEVDELRIVNAPIEGK